MLHMRPLHRDVLIPYVLSLSSVLPICLRPLGLTWAGLCSPRMATTRASGTVTPLPGDMGLSGLTLGDRVASGETSLSFLAEAQGERLRLCPSLGRGQRLRPCREGRGLDESAGRAGLRLRRWRWCCCCCLPVLGLGLRESGASSTSVLSSSELTSELSVRHTVGLWAGILIFKKKSTKKPQWTAAFTLGQAIDTHRVRGGSSEISM